MKTNTTININSWKAVLLAFLFIPFLAVAQPTEEEIQQSIDWGLEWLVSQQNAVDGSWSGYGIKEAGTGLALYKLCERANELGYDSPFDEDYEYHQNVIDGFEWIFANVHVMMINSEDHTGYASGTVDDPDVNGNGSGVYASYYNNYHNYLTGIILAAISSSGTPDRLVDVAGSDVDGWTFLTVAQDMVDFLSWGQVEYTDAGGNIKEGGWDYSPVDDGTGGSNWKGDQSNSGYAVLGLAEAQDFGCTIPQWVKDELSAWVDYVQDDVDDPVQPNDGGSWYSYPGDYIGINTLKTGNLLTQMALAGDTPETQRVMDAVDYLVRHWADAGGGNAPPGWNGNPYGTAPAQYQAMFCIMKGLVFLGIDEIDGIDWFADMSTAIVAQQYLPDPPNADYGAWLYSSGRGEKVIITEWALLTLEKIAPLPPVMYVDFDVNPTSWPNPININSKGNTPAAILGTEEFDVYTIDPSTLYLDLPDGMVYPIMWAYEDITVPAGDEGGCNATEEGPDGFMDLTLKFSTPEIAAALGDVNDGDELVIYIKGMQEEGQNIEGDDCIWIIDNKITEVSNLHAFQLGQNHPNPVVSTTRIDFTLPESSHVTLRLYDMMGHEMAVLADRDFSAGTHSILFNAENLSNGMYIYRMISKDQTATRQMMIRN